MAYVGRAGGDGDRDACVFCDRLDGDDDVAALVLLRLDRVFVILNLYPYASGHMMVIPHYHDAAIEDTPPEVLAEVAATLPLVTRAARRVLGCAGFNIGMNVGAVAGAGIADHLHLHVVPRWPGDANFMPVLAQTAVLPEALPATYAKIRLELARELRRPTAAGSAPATDDSLSHRPPSHDPGVQTLPRIAAAPDPGGTIDPSDLDSTPTPLVVTSPDGTRIWIRADPAGPLLPTVTPGSDESIWRAAARAVAHLGPAAVVGLTGPPAALTRATSSAAPLALHLRLELESPPSSTSDATFVPLSEARYILPALTGWPIS